jgi:hypothetical protein
MRVEILSSTRVPDVEMLVPPGDGIVGKGSGTVPTEGSISLELAFMNGGIHNLVVGHVGQVGRPVFMLVYVSPSPEYSRGTSGT